MSLALAGSAAPSLSGRIEAAALELLPENARRAWLAFKGKRDTFKGAEVNRIVADWAATLLHPDDELRWNVRRLRARARELQRNNPWARGYLNGLAVNVIGPDGPRLQARVRDNDGKLSRRINTTIEEAWADFCDAPTLDGRQSMAELERLLIKSTARDGEQFIRIRRGVEVNRYGLALESIDPDQFDETFNDEPRAGAGEIRMGIEVDQYGRPAFYHPYDKPSKMNMLPRERVKIPAEDIIHLVDIERVNQTRGFTWFVAVMVALKMLDGYTEAELVAARTAASKMGWFTRKANPTAGEIVPDPVTNTYTMDANPGTFEFAPDGYEFSSWSPDHPTSAFADFVKGMLRQVATGVSMSYNAFANDLENVNYSSMRSGLLIEREMWRCLQAWWIRAFRKRVYREWMNAALLTGALKLDSRDATKFYAAKWTARGWPWVDPLKDVQAAALAIQTGLGSRTAFLAEEGEDFETVMEALAEETALAEELGVDISGPKKETVTDPNAADNADGEADTGKGKGKDAAKGNGNGNGKTTAGKSRAELVAAFRDRGINGRG
jgi:lambda family phage portal protein